MVKIDNKSALATADHGQQTTNLKPPPCPGESDTRSLGHRPSALSLFLLLLSFFFLDACSSSQPTAKVPTPQGESHFQVSDQFSDFYDALGGEKILGMVISSMFDRGSLSCQFTMNTLMCLDPAKIGVDQFSLASLGLDLVKETGFSDPPPPLTGEPGQYVVEGYVIFPDFVPLFDSLYGTRFTGRPLSQARMNPDQRRIEQYFENVIFAVNINDRAAQPYLLTLGHYYCGEQRCGTSGLGPGIILPPNVPVPFAKAIQQMDGFDIFGNPLTQPFFTPEGDQVQIFENVMVCARKETPNKPGLCPISAALGLVSNPPGEKRYGIADNIVFYAFENGLGYHVPVDFDNFLQNHGGGTISGHPIADVIRYKDGAIRQCFENYCLEYHAEAPEGSRVSMTPLGSIYLKRGLSEGKIDPAVVLGNYLTRNTVILMPSELKPQISPGEEQTIFVAVLQKDNKAPLPNVMTKLTIRTPDNSLYTFEFPPTDANGNASVVVPALDQPSGSVIPYDVCLSFTAGEPVCASDSFLIVWGSK